ncbi:hypothetical protein [Nitrosomonas sp. Nm34]|uniref:hypothetical protein n=1 Tax=Nitrosomonas sp. Nm34 TaxID=1881055 RepID=UPI0008E9B98E|nr:hypothetical protein [Nitrosomonas sp. Nm34]SFI47433.1 hypothetical protein SAMN05428978_101217 [Nitrosomonas sp. Nm34]
MNFKMKMTSLLASVALLAGAGIANAQEPLRLSETSMDNITAGTFNYPTFTSNVSKDWNLSDYSYIGAKTNIISDPYIKDMTAHAEAQAGCQAGTTCLATGGAITQTGDYYHPTLSISTSTSSSSGYPHY